MNTIVTEQPMDPSALSASATSPSYADVLSRVGHMTRSLHESLRGLGLDKVIEKAAHEIPNVKDRLNYVAMLSEQAAQRVLNATDAAGPLQDKIEENGESLKKEWQAALQRPFSEEQFHEIAGRTQQYLDETCSASVDTRKYLMEIMMAQDFQDLTGQVIKKITELAQTLEQQLVQLLIDFAPSEMKRDAGAGLLNGPQINQAGNPEVVSDQEQVDDLLDSLGF